MTSGHQFDGQVIACVRQFGDMGGAQPAGAEHALFLQAEEGLAGIGPGRQEARLRERQGGGGGNISGQHRKIVQHGMAPSGGSSFLLDLKSIGGVDGNFLSKPFMPVG
jgi:hypothetical protein